jgi:hypothetical protein
LLAADASGVQAIKETGPSERLLKKS